jgi:adenylate cyclase
MSITVCMVRPARRAFEDALKVAEHAVRLAPSSPEAHHALAVVLATTGEAESAISSAKRAIDLNPNYSEAYGILGLALTFSGDLEGGLAACQQAARSSPRDARGRLLLNGMGWAYYMLGNYEQAIEVSKKGLQLDSLNYGSMVTLAASYARLDRQAEARRHVDQLLRLIPRINLRALRKNPMFLRPEHIDNLVEGMRLAGLPE